MYTRHGYLLIAKRTTSSRAAAVVRSRTVCNRAAYMCVIISIFFFKPIYNIKSIRFMISRLKMVRSSHYYIMYIHTYIYISHAGLSWFGRNVTCREWLYSMTCSFYLCNWLYMNIIYGIGVFFDRNTR